MATENKSDFDALLADISALATDVTKSTVTEDTAAADKKIEAAADEGVENSDAEVDGDKDVAKSFKLKLEDGTEIDAMDGSALFKSLSERVEKNETTVLSAVKGMVDVVKSLAGQVAVLSNTGKGRKAVVSIAEKPAATEVNKSETEGVSPDQFFAKALAMQAKGELNGTDVRRAEAYLNKGLPIPAEIIKRVLG